MRFCPWYPLTDADRHAPASGGVFRIRIPDGLVDYPTGKSAMIHYEASGDLRAAIAAFRSAHPIGAGWLCRHTIEMTGSDLAESVELHARLLRDFTSRFGTAPTIPAPTPDRSEIDPDAPAPASERLP
jgi:hypothetical protein